MRHDDKGGVDYAIAHEGLYARFGFEAGEPDLEWVKHTDDATVYDTAEEALNEMYARHMADGTKGHLTPSQGYSVVEVPWINEEDVEPGPLDREGARLAGVSPSEL